MKMLDYEVPWTSVPQLLALRAAERPDAVALIVAGEAIDFATWHVRSNALAAGLARYGIREGDHVLSMLGNCLEQVLLWLGVAKAGAVWVPINDALAGDDLRDTILNAEPRIIVTDTRGQDRIRSCSDPLPDDWRIYLTDDASSTASFEILFDDDAPVPSIDLAPSAPAAILYSGGTTGLPKGVVLSHFTYIAGGYRYGEFWQPRPGDVHLTVMQLYHAGAQFGAALAPLFHDVVGVIERRFSASGYWRRVCESGATLIDPLGTMLPFLTAQPPGPYDRAHKVRACWFATAHLPISQRSAFEERFAVRLFPGTYASTECGGNYVVSARFDDPHHPEGAIGKPWGWAEICIADAEDRPLPPGAVGNVLLRPTVANMFMKGYNRDAARTAAAMRNFWLHTGDLGRLDDNGYFYFEGRDAHWLRRRGENISAYEIEAVLVSHPDVAEAVVVGVPAELGGEEEVKAFLIPKPGASLNPPALHAWCRSRMTPFKIPRYIAIVGDLPRSATKREVERAKLRMLPHTEAWDFEASQNDA